MKIYTLRSHTMDNGRSSIVDLRLEFEGRRAFVIWDMIPLGDYQITARLEINPELLQKTPEQGYDFFYRGELVLPRPENN